jgi:predicted methyltransferase
MNFRISLLLFGALMLCAITSSGAPKQPPDYIVTAIVDPSRPAEDRAQDINRHPEAVLAFSGLMPGAKVVDLMPGSGYYTRILSKAVGARGKIYALQPVETDKAAPKDCRAFTASLVPPTIRISL